MISKQVLQPIRDRYSSVCFSEKLIDDTKIEALFEAARWAASAYNDQPWRFVYATKNDEKAYNELYSLLFDGNKGWAGKAPLLILTIAKTISDYTKKTNIYAMHDTGLATSNLLLQAVSMGLQVHTMGGFDKTQAIIKLKIPNGFEPVTMIAVGYKGDINELSEELKDRETKIRTRKELDSIVFKGIFGIRN
ncbi:MAG: nitroreductase family protein [Bacteroidales bacterium]|nr:nitroreductase family protein [Bacteroidales bacterium]